MLSFTFTSDPDWVPGLIFDTQVLGGLRGPIFFFFCACINLKNMFIKFLCYVSF